MGKKISSLSKDSEKFFST